MTVSLIVFLLAGAFAGGFINGLAGFGTALFALGFWLQVLPAPTAVAIAVVMSVTSGLQGLWVVRGTIVAKPRRLLRFLLPAIPGIPLGVSLLTVVEPSILKLAIAGFLLAYGGFFAFRRNLPKLERPTPIVDGAIGFLGGVLGGAASLSGALPTMWCALRPWPKAETRAVLQPFNVAVLSLTLIIFVLKGSFDWPTLHLIAIALPATLAGAKIGILVFHRLEDDQFRRLQIGLMFISGLILAVGEFV